MRKTDATVLKLNHFIKPKTAFAAFLSERGEGEVSLDIKGME